MAFHAAGFIAQPGDDQAAGHGNAVFHKRDVVVTRYTVDDRADGRWSVHGAGSAAVGAQEVLVARAAVALGAFRRHFGRVFLVPVVEGFGRGISMA